MHHTNYHLLTDEEKYQLGEEIANGNISRSCSDSDWFNITLKCSGRRVCGSYKWGSDDGEFTRLSIYNKRKRV